MRESFDSTKEVQDMVDQMLSMGFQVTDIADTEGMVKQYINGISPDEYYAIQDI